MSPILKVIQFIGVAAVSFGEGVVLKVPPQEERSQSPPTNEATEEKGELPPTLVVFTPRGAMNHVRFCDASLF